MPVNSVQDEPKDGVEVNATSKNSLILEWLGISKHAPKNNPNKPRPVNNGSRYAHEQAKSEPKTRPRPLHMHNPEAKAPILLSQNKWQENAKSLRFEESNNNRFRIPTALSPKLQSLIKSVKDPKAGKAFMGSLNPKDRLVYKAVLSVLRPDKDQDKYLKRLLMDPKKDQQKQRFFAILFLLAKFRLLGNDIHFSSRMLKRARMILAFSKALKRRRRRKKRRKELGLLPGILAP